jgi:predicted dinucleotide-binding enzyme
MKSIGSPMRIGIMGTGGIGGCGGAKLAGKGADVLAGRRHSSSARIDILPDHAKGAA